MPWWVSKGHVMHDLESYKKGDSQKFFLFFLKFKWSIFGTSNVLKEHTGRD